jgi:Fe2+ or Zn2+ uptake regulation protein
MSISLTCKGCTTVITAQDEDELVALQRHIVNDHNGSHTPTREQILAILHRQGGDRL